MSNPLEDYLNQFRLQLKGMSPEQRDAEVEEARQHLEALIQERIKAGDSQEIATAKAIRQFGDARDNGKALQQTWQQESGMNRLIPWIHALLATSMLCVAATHLIYAFYGSSHGTWTHLLWTRLGPPVLTVTAGTSVMTLQCLELYVFCSVLGMMSLLWPRILRTIFFGIFAAIMAFDVAAGIAVLFVAPRTPLNWLVAGVPCAVEVACLALSLFCVAISIKRDNSIIARLYPPRLS